VCPFEDGEEGTGIASDVKVQGEDPDTPDYLRGDRVRRMSECVPFGSLVMKSRDFSICFKKQSNTTELKTQRQLYHDL